MEPLTRICKCCKIRKPIKEFKKQYRCKTEKRGNICKSCRYKNLKTKPNSDFETNGWWNEKRKQEWQEKLEQDKTSPWKLKRKNKIHYD